MVPDVDIAAQVGKDFFLDEKIPRHELGQGYVRVVEQSIMWRETEISKVFTYQGLTTCTELDKSWTIMSSIYNHLRQGRDKSINELKFFIRAEVELQERLETMGYRSPTWRLLRALQSAAAGRVGSYGTSLLPQCRERHNEILGQKAGANSFPVGESGRRRTRRM